MIYYTGDTHGEVEKLIAFSERFHLTPEDTIVILGDAGWNYYTDKRDFLAKSFLKRLGVTIFSIHGNHEARPGKLSFYHEAEWRGGSVYVEDEFPNILFAKDGEVYDLDGHIAIAIGGAYSVDKYYRLSHWLKWFSDEQPDDEMGNDQQNDQPLDIHPPGPIASHQNSQKQRVEGDDHADQNRRSAVSDHQLIRHGDLAPGDHAEGVKLGRFVPDGLLQRVDLLGDTRVGRAVADIPDLHQHGGPLFSA